MSYRVRITAELVNEMNKGRNALNAYKGGRKLNDKDALLELCERTSALTTAVLAAASLVSWKQEEAGAFFEFGQDGSVTRGVDLAQQFLRETAGPALAKGALSQYESGLAERARHHLSVLLDRITTSVATMAVEDLTTIGEIAPSALLDVAAEISAALRTAPGRGGASN